MENHSHCCCAGHFTCGDRVQLLLTNKDHIEIWEEKLNSRELHLVYKLRTQQVVAVINPFHVPGWLQDDRDGLLAISEAADLQLLFWDDKTQSLQELCHIPNALPTGSRPRHHQLRASQPIVLGSALCCAIAGENGRLTVAVVRRGGAAPIRFTGTFCEASPPHDERSGGPLGSAVEALCLSFLTDREGRPEVDLHGRPLLAQLYRESALDGCSTSLILSALDLKTGELHRCWHVRDLSSMTCLMLTIAGSGTQLSERRSKIVILSSTGAIAYDQTGCVCMRICYQIEGTITAAMQLGDSVLVIGDSSGGLQAVDLSSAEPVARPLQFDPESEGEMQAGVQTLIRFKSEEGSPTLVCIRQNGQTALIRIPGVDSVCSIWHVPSSERSGLAPVHDFTAVLVSPLESVLFLAHGTGRHGSLTRVQEAAELTTGDAVAIVHQGLEIPSLLPLSLPPDSDLDGASVILSYEKTSRIFCRSTHAMWRPLAAAGFDETLRTLAVGAVDDGSRFVQVTSRGVRLIDASLPYNLRQEVAGLVAANEKATRGKKLGTSEASPLHLADVKGSRVVVAGTDQIRTFQVDRSEIRNVSSRKGEHQISAVSLSTSSSCEEEERERRASDSEASSSQKYPNRGSKGEQRLEESKQKQGQIKRQNSTGRKGNGSQTEGRKGPLEDPAFVVVGYWTSHVVEVLRWSDLGVVTRVHLGGSDLPRSVKLVQLSGVNRLLVGTAEGGLLYYECHGEALEGFHTTAGRRVRVGSAPVSLTVLSGRRSAVNGDTMTGSSSRRETRNVQEESYSEGQPLERCSSSVEVYANSDSDVLLKLDAPAEGPVELAPARVSGGEGWLHVAALEDDRWLVVGEDGEIRTAALDRRVEPRRRSFSLGVTPRLVTFHEPSCCLVVACASEHGAHSLRVFHARSLAQLAEIGLEGGHVPTCLRSLILPLRKIDGLDSYGDDSSGTRTAREFVVVASTMTTGEHAQSVVSVFDVEQRPAGEDRVEFRLVVLGAYSTGAIICSMSSVSVAPSGMCSGCDDKTFSRSEGLGFVGNRSTQAVGKQRDLQGLESVPMLAVGTHEGLQVLSVNVDPTGDAEVAGLAEQALREALGESCVSESDGGETNENSPDVNSDGDGFRVLGSKMDGASEGEQVGLLRLRVEAEVKLSGAVTGQHGSGNVLFACLANGPLLVYEALQTSTGVQLAARSQAKGGAQLTSVFALSTSRVLVGGQRKMRLLERIPEAEAAFQDSQKHAAVRISEAGGLDLTQQANGTEGRHSIPEGGKDLPVLDMQGLDCVLRQPLLRLSRLHWKLGTASTHDKVTDGPLQDLVAVFEDGTTELLPTAFP